MIDTQRQPMPMVQGLPTCAIVQIYSDERIIGTAKRGGFTISVVAVVRGWWCNALKVGVVELGSTLEYQSLATTKEEAVLERQRFQQFAPTIVNDAASADLIPFRAEGTAEFYPEVLEHYARWCEKLAELVDTIETVEEHAAGPDAAV